MAADNAIGTGAVVLTADADGLSAGLAKAQADVESWGAKVGAGLKSGLGVAAAAGAGVVAAVGETFKTAVERLDDLAKVNKRADVLGVSASDLMGMDELFRKVGVEAGQADAVFAKMGKSIRDLTEEARAFEKAQQQAGEKGLDAASALAAQFEAKAKIAALGKMGITVAQLEGKALTEQFKIIADGINRLPRGYEQAAAAQDLFGRSGAMLLPMLQRGSKGIEEFIADQRAMGQVLSDTQLKSAGDASKAWKEAKKEVEEAWDGFKNQLALVAAPAVKEIAENGKELIRDFLVPAAKSAAEMADGFVKAGVALKNMKPAEGSGGGGSEFFKGTHGESSFWDYFPKASEVGPAVGTAFTGLADAFTNAYRESDRFNLGKLFNPSKYGKFGERTRPPADMTERFLAELHKPPPPPPPVPTGVISGWLAKAREMERVMGQVRAAVGPDFGVGILRSLPWVGMFERAAEGAAPLWDRIAGNLGRGNAGPWSRLVNEPMKFAAAMEQGSKEAYSLELRTRYRDFGAPGADSPQKEAVKELQKNNQKLDKLTITVEKLHDGFSRIEGF